MSFLLVFNDYEETVLDRLANHYECTRGELVKKAIEIMEDELKEHFRLDYGKKRTNKL